MVYIAPMTQPSTKPVTLYTTTTCPYCTSAKRLLDERGISYVEIDLTGKPEERAEISAKTGMRTVPMILFGDECIGGFTDLAALDSAGELAAKLSAE